MNFDQRMKDTNFRPAGFDYLRLGLSLAVVVSHSIDTSYGWEHTRVLWTTTPFGKIGQFIMPMFFALSGFLVAGSLERSRTVSLFLGLRVIRIYPALIVETILSAFILGPLLTTIPLHEYFTNPLFFSYMWNVIGHPHYYLPGLFETTPFGPKVNSQLWTVPFELFCYIVLGFLAILGGRRKRVILLAGTVLLTLAALALQIVRYGSDFPAYWAALPGPFLVLSFLAGVCLYVYRERIPDSLPLFVASLVACLLCLYFVEIGAFLIAFPVAYMTAWIGLRNPARIAILKGADYSYGIFLYHFVIQQSLMQMLPWAHHWYWNMLLTLPIVSGFAAFSWHFIEKPSLRVKPKMYAIETRHLARLGQTTEGALSRALGWRQV